MIRLIGFVSLIFIMCSSVAANASYRNECYVMAKVEKTQNEGVYDAYIISALDVLGTKGLDYLCQDSIGKNIIIEISGNIPLVEIVRLNHLTYSYMTPTGPMGGDEWTYAPLQKKDEQP